MKNSILPLSMLSSYRGCARSFYSTLNDTLQNKIPTQVGFSIIDHKTFVDKPPSSDTPFKKCSKNGHFNNNENDSGDLSDMSIVNSDDDSNSDLDIDDKTVYISPEEINNQDLIKTIVPKYKKQPFPDPIDVSYFEKMYKISTEVSNILFFEILKNTDQELGSLDFFKWAKQAVDKIGTIRDLWIAYVYAIQGVAFTDKMINDIKKSKIMYSNDVYNTVKILEKGGSFYTEPREEYYLYLVRSTLNTALQMEVAKCTTKIRPSRTISLLIKKKVDIDVVFSEFDTETNNYTGTDGYSNIENMKTYTDVIQWMINDTLRIFKEISKEPKIVDDRWLSVEDNTYKVDERITVYLLCGMNPDIIVEYRNEKIPLVLALWKMYLYYDNANKDYMRRNEIQSDPKRMRTILLLASVVAAGAIYTTLGYPALEGYVRLGKIGDGEELERFNSKRNKTMKQIACIFPTKD